LTLTRDRKYLKTEFERNKPALGSCLGAFSSTFPVAFLEPHSNKHNQYSLLNRIADHSLEAQDIMAKMDSSMPTLETIMLEVEQYVESEKVEYKKEIKSPEFLNMFFCRAIKRHSTSSMLYFLFSALTYLAGGHKGQTMSAPHPAITSPW
jgi:hypothetical protein